MPELHKSFRSPFPVTVQETTEDENDILFRIRNLGGETVFSVDNLGNLDSEILGAIVNPDGTLKGSYRESSLSDSQWGLSLDGTDDSAVIAAALTEFSADGGGTMYVPGGGITIGIAGYVDPPNNVNLWGQGSGYESGNWATRFLCLDSTSGLRFSTGAAVKYNDRVSGNFFVDGGSVAPNPVYIGQATDSYFAHFHVRNAASGSAAVICEYGQNNILIDFQTSQNKGEGMRLDHGWGGNVHIKTELQSSGIANLVIQESGAGGGDYTKPTHNTFIGGLLERVHADHVADFVADLVHSNGERNVFYNFGLAVSLGGPREVVLYSGGSHLKFVDCHWNDNNADTNNAINMTGGTVCWMRDCSFHDFLNVYDGDADAEFYVTRPFYSTCTNIESAALIAANANAVITGPEQHPTWAYTRSTSGFHHRLFVDGETNSRVWIGPFGMQMGSGSGAAQVAVHRLADNILSLVGTRTRTTGHHEVDGDFDHDGTNVGFYNVAPVARPAAYTQTYSTASRTHSALTSATLTDNSGGTANTTIQAMADPTDAPATADALRDDIAANLLPAIRNNIADLTAQVNALIADVANVKQVVNQVIDDHQANGLLQ